MVINDGGGLFRFGGWGLEARDRTFENGGFVGHKRDGYYQLLWVTVAYCGLLWVTDGSCQWIGGLVNWWIDEVTGVME